MKVFTSNLLFLQPVGRSFTANALAPAEVANQQGGEQQQTPPNTAKEATSRNAADSNP